MLLLQYWFVLRIKSSGQFFCKNFNWIYSLFCSTMKCTFHLSSFFLSEFHHFLRWICFKNYKGNESVIKNSFFLKYRWKNFNLSSVCPSISNLSFLLIGLFSNGHVRQMSKGRHSFWLKIFGVMIQALRGIDSYFGNHTLFAQVLVKLFG